ncbi:hypothetical protein HS088_TW04G01126 [Tripterygium wilfordii]|uniref:SHSP domain-containing protein n=1 Tax=Tripterygium wilfordii TaxID=458696 RepID=A0A7J7DS93_TRIWF|nr:hypothetical protein HS088_TW04G01126 [Tripterygium wilfordii]
MATKTAGAGATGKRSYEDFEPFCKWQKQEEHDTLEVHLHGLKKDQLRVQLNNLGVLTISGSRPLDETRWSRFHKEIKVSKDCKRNEIHAKFSNGILYVVMPKRSSQSQDQAIPKTNSHNKENPKQAQNATKESMDVTGTSTSISGETDKSFKGRVSRLVRAKPMIVGVAAVAVAVVVVLVGIYVMNKYQAPHHLQN